MASIGHAIPTLALTCKIDTEREGMRERERLWKTINCVMPELVSTEV